jgi:hypothetical protein
VKEVLAFFPVAIIIGDAKSNNTLTCCIPLHYEQPKMSRTCYTSFANCFKHEHQRIWVEKEDQEELSGHSPNPDSAMIRNSLPN